MTNIYGLFDPRQPDVVMYVGKGNERRVTFHWQEFINHRKASNGLLLHWFNQLQADGVRPEWRFLEVVDDAAWEGAEIKWIAYWREHNPKLCNLAKGGNSPAGKGIIKNYDVVKALYPDHFSKMGKLGGHKGGLKGGPAYHVKYRGTKKYFEDASKGGQISYAIHTDAWNRGAAKAGHKVGSANLKHAWAHKRDVMINNQRAAASRGGKIGGKRMHALHPGLISRAMFAAMHIRWHVKRNKPNPTCWLCQTEAE